MTKNSFFPFLFCSLICVCFFLFGTGFTDPPVVEMPDSKSDLDSTLATKYIDESDSLFQIRKIDVAIQRLEKAKIFFKNAQLWKGFVDAYLSLAKGQMYTADFEKCALYLDSAALFANQYFPPTAQVFANIYGRRGDLLLQLEEIDSATIYLLKSATISKNNEEWEAFVWTQISLSINYYYLGNFQLMEKVLADGLEIAQKFLSPQHEVLEHIFNNQAALFNQIGEFEKGFETGKKALEYALELGIDSYEDSLNLAIRYQNLGVLYSNNGERERATKQYFLALNLYQNLNVHPRETYSLLFNIGKSFVSKNDFKSANASFQQALSILNSDKKLPLKKRAATRFVETYNALGRLFLKQENFDSALFYLNLALPISQEFDRRLDITFENFGLLNENLGNYSKAASFYEKAILANEKYYGKKHTRSHPMYKKMAEMQLEVGDLEAALATCQKAILNQTKEAPIEDIFYNPPIEKVRDKLTYELILDLKIKILQKLNLPKYANLIYESCKTAVELIDLSRKDYQREEGRIYVSKKAFPLFERAISSTSNLYENSGNDTYFQEAFSFAEQSKALLLLESLQDLEENFSQKNPDLADLLKKEKKLNSDLILYQRKVFDENRKGKNGNQNKIETWQKKLAELRIEEENIRFRLEQDFPDYYHLNSDVSMASVQDIQKQLSQQSDFKETVLIEYFVGDSSIYTFFISKNDFQILETPKNQALENAILTFQNSQNSNPSLFNSNEIANQNFQNYTQSAHFLYQKLLAPILENQSFEKLIIVPDGNLGYLSFEAFLTNQPTSEQINYAASNLDYLIEKYQIAYAYSGTLFLENLKPKKQFSSNNYAGFAPVFQKENKLIASERGCSEGQLGYLENSEKSVRKVQQILGGNIFLNEAANKDEFLLNAPNYRLLHLSTHACVDDFDPMFNKVYFADDYLATYELYNLKLNADLVVLSACETGRGELIRGEGIMSLARGFMQAGCPSIITSLWNANDFSTSEIMITFHENIAEGLPKDAALRNAKLTYLENSPSRLSPPYFWATFVGIGNMEAMYFGNNWGDYWWMFLGISCSLGIAVYLFLKK